MKLGFRLVQTALLFSLSLGTTVSRAQGMETADDPSANTGISSRNILKPGSRGTPTGKPVKRQSLTPAAFNALLTASAPGLLQITGAPKCTVDIYSLGYRTVGGRNEPTTATTAVMIPSGSASECRGPRPIVLVAHGTSADKNYDLASLQGDINGQNEGLGSAAFFAAQGFIVVQPNYAGYAGSTLDYAPFLNAEQQSADMIDALRASRRAFRSVALNSIGSKLFLTGYSQGAYVAMATERAMQRYPHEFRPAAVAMGSGPYAVSLLIDKVVGGAPSAAAPLLFNLIATSWQRSYGNVYRQPGELYASQYAARAQGLLPSAVPQNTLFAQNALPPRALFESGSLPPPDTSNPDTALVNQAGFAPANFYLSTRFRDRLVADIAEHPCSDGRGRPVASCRPRTGLRQDALRNDLLNFTPRAPLLMCGAHSDSLVYFFNTTAAADYFKGRGVRQTALTVIDIDPGANPPSGPFAALQAGFTTARDRAAAELGNTADASLRLSEKIHTLAAPFCILAARSFFLSKQ